MKHRFPLMVLSVNIRVNPWLDIFKHKVDKFTNNLSDIS